MAQHTINVPITVNDSQYIEIIKAQQASGRRSVESFLRGLIEKSLAKQKAPKSAPEVAKAPKAKKAPKPESAKDILAAAGFTMPSDAGPVAEPAPAPVKIALD